LFLLPLSGLVYGWVRRSTVRRIRTIQTPFPEQWERALSSHVEFFRSLDDEGKERFRNLVKVFLDEITITGIRTEVDELTRTLVAASAVIPIFGFDDWEYSRLGEVLIYPNAFGGDYQTDEGTDRNTLGMIGVNHLSGVMILSKPDLINGFANPADKRNVGIHEFAHLVDKADGFVDGIPAGIPATTVRPWIGWVARELSQKDDGSGHIDGYAYTNEAEYFAVLSEYFFEAPETLQRKSPEMYAMLQAMYRQDTKSMFRGMLGRRPSRIGRNSPCPCGSGKKFKLCCGARGRRGRPAVQVKPER
jgi:Mlc titration factor MtfA (ptsG expression regulator)